MFRTNQILTSTELLKHFRAIARLLDNDPQALLVLQRNGVRLVLLNAEIYEELMLKSFERPGPKPFESEPKSPPSA
jgi:PHD/YefM family antitoxin component YafN of YafNO toxin-antitoxin module